MDGLITVRSSRDVDSTMAAIRTQAEGHGAMVIAVVDHAAAARKAGQDLPATQVIIFGNPAAGTPLMQATPEIAIDLPLRIMVRAEGDGSVVTWQDPAYVADRYGLAADHLKPLQAPAAIVDAALG
ncbi:DUF302 domain-containing protein [Micromonospora sp. GCM10011542]|uniref:DUF302 domain-containing protein n=1 Tax=Micromonospora sp. GCM10011542 TaxID=3317337 RepID=UPI003605C75E